MSRWSPFRSAKAGRFVILGLGGSYVALALGRTVLVTVGGNEALANTLIDFVLIGVPGVGLLYGGYWLSRSDVSPDVYPRIAGWCLGGGALLLGIVGLLVVNPDVTVDHLFWSATLATALGAVGGFAIGTKEAQAITRAYEAERQKRTLQQQNDRLESFASMLAHELRNPLTIAQIYLPQAADGDPDAADEVGTALDRIEEMIDVLLVTARAAAVETEREAVSLGDVAADAWADLSPEAATLVVGTDREIRMDPVHLRHLFENLFRNAVEHGSTSSRDSRDDVHQTKSDAAHQNPSDSEDAVEHGSASNRPEADDALAHGDGAATVRVGDLPDGFYVEDDGSGVPEAERDAVFEAGYTTDATGIGLGLTFVSQLAENYGWECRLTDGESGGARFEFTGVEIAPVNEQ